MSTHVTRIATATAAAIVATALAASHAAPAAAETATRAAAAITVEVELSETTQGKAGDAVRATLTIADEVGCASVATDVGDTGYELKVCRERSADATAVLSFEVSRVVRRHDAATRQKFRMSARLAAGKRVAVGRIERGDVITELAAEVR